MDTFFILVCASIFIIPNHALQTFLSSSESLNYSLPWHYCFLYSFWNVIVKAYSILLVIIRTKLSTIAILSVSLLTPWCIDPSPAYLHFWRHPAQVSWDPSESFHSNSNFLILSYCWFQWNYSLLLVTWGARILITFNYYLLLHITDMLHYTLCPYNIMWHIVYLVKTHFLPITDICGHSFSSLLFQIFNFFFTVIAE